MKRLLLPLHLPLSLSLLVLVSGAPAAEELRYSGQLSETARGGRSTPVKDFDVTCWTTAGGDAAFYLTREDSPPLPWVEQYGQAALSEGLFALSGPTIGYRHQERSYTVPVPVPFFREFSELAPNAVWERSGIAYEVVDERTVDGRPCWRVRVRTGPARTHTLLVRQDRPLIVEATQTVFMGQGDRFELTLKLTQARPLEPAQAAAIAAVTTPLLELKGDMQREEHDRFAPLTSKQLETAARRSPPLPPLAKETPLAKFVGALRDDVERRSQRQERVEELAESMLNERAPRFTLTDLSGEAVDPDSYARRLLVLHFWDYQDEPLQQPYGQVGYLDFLNTRWQNKEVSVIGVAVHSRLSDPETRSEGLRSVRRLQRFMRIGYPITFDGGAVLNAFGNPTRLGEDLPLWIVISPEGKIVHYKTGYYEVDNQVGLSELDKIVEENAPGK